MTPAEVKSIRLSLRTSKNEPPSQKNFAEFLGMGNASIARYELGKSEPLGIVVNLLRLCRLPEALSLLVFYAKREGRYSDIVQIDHDFIGLSEKIK